MTGELILTREIAAYPAQFDLQLHVWRNRTRIETTRRDRDGKFTTERKSA